MKRYQKLMNYNKSTTWSEVYGDNCILRNKKELKKQSNFTSEERTRERTV